MKKILTYMIAAAVLTACSTTRRVPDGDQLYTGIKSMKFVDEDKYAATETGQTAIEEITYALDYPPNGSFASSSSLKTFSIGLWIYNTFYNSKKGVGKWIFDKFGTEPVLISKVTPELRAEVANDVLKYYGYFNGKVEAKVNTNKKNPKKASVSYEITLNEPLTYDSISYCNFPEIADTIIQNNISNEFIKERGQFNAAAMENERIRISNLLRNNGFYHFRPDLLTYLADTVNSPGKANIRLQTIKEIPVETYNRYRIGKINMRVFDSDFEGGNGRGLKGDTLNMRTMQYIYYDKKPPVRPGALMRNIQIRKGELYSLDKQQRAVQMLTQMNIFNSINFNMVPRLGTDTIDMNIITRLDKPYDFTFELNTTYKSNSQIGPGSKITLARRNVFRGGETLKLSLTGSYEWQTDRNVKGRAATINSWEMGADLSLEFPRIFFPIIHRRHLRTPAITSFRIFTDQMNRSGFFRMIHAGGDATYKIFSSSASTHTVTPLRVTYDMLLKTTARFDSIAAANRSVENSFRNQFIPAMQYTYNYDNTNSTHRNKTWLEVSVTSAGNVTSLIYCIFGKSMNEKDKNILGNPYAQFIKTTAEIRELWKINRKQSIATRFMVGAIHSYGNSEYAPYSEQFYTGGANSLRAFTVRSLGPGSYRPSSSDRYSYLDETGTFKMEMNVEYRFQLFADLHGAVFVDAGNIWLLKKDPDRPGGELKINKFGEQIALNTGFGIRYDLGILVARVDFGLGLHAPYKTKRNGYFNLNPFKDGFAWHFAIGYPF